MAKDKVRKVMSEFKSGDLRSGSGSKVKSRKQAVAIALKEAGKAGTGTKRYSGEQKVAAARRGAERAGRSGARERRLGSVSI